MTNSYYSSLDQHSQPVGYDLPWQTSISKNIYITIPIGSKVTVMR